MVLGLGLTTGTSSVTAKDKSELVESIASESRVSQLDATKALEAFITPTTNALEDDGQATWEGFGSFSISKRSARTGRNPQTGKDIQIPARNVLKFNAGAELSRHPERIRSPIGPLSSRPSGHVEGELLYAGRNDRQPGSVSVLSVFPHSGDHSPEHEYIYSVSSQVVLCPGRSVNGFDRHCSSFPPASPGSE